MARDANPADDPVCILDLVVASAGTMFHRRLPPHPLAGRRAEKRSAFRQSAARGEAGSAEYADAIPPYRLQGIGSKRIGKVSEAVCSRAFVSMRRVALAPIYAPSAASRSSPEPSVPPVGFFPAVGINRVVESGLVCDARYARLSRGFANQRRKPTAHRRDGQEQHRRYNDRIECEGIHAGEIVTIDAIPRDRLIILSCVGPSQCAMSVLSSGCRNSTAP